jgi:hypothetical protein
VDLISSKRLPTRRREDRRWVTGGLVVADKPGLELVVDRPQTCRRASYGHDLGIQGETVVEDRNRSSTAIQPGDLEAHA